MIELQVVGIKTGWTRAATSTGIPRYDDEKGKTEALSLNRIAVSPSNSCAIAFSKAQGDAGAAEQSDFLSYIRVLDSIRHTVTLKCSICGVRSRCIKKVSSSKVDTLLRCLIL
jgi:hypothetical protein